MRADVTGVFFQLSVEKAFARWEMVSHVGVFLPTKPARRFLSMTPYKKRLNKYIQRMAEDMQVRNFADATIDAYTYHADKFCQYFGRSADQLGPEQIREYQRYLVNEKKASWSSFNQAVCGLRFLYEVTLNKNWTVRHIPLRQAAEEVAGGALR